MNNPHGQTVWQRAGVTPGRLVLMGVLAVTLAYVLISQLPVRQPTTHATPSRAEKDSVQATAQTVTQPSTAAAKPWPAVNLAVVEAHDPFARPGWAGLPVAEAQPGSASDDMNNPTRARNVLDQLMAAGTNAIVIVDDERLALIGERQIRIGDRVEGLTVTDITEAGIILTNEGKD